MSTYRVNLEAGANLPEQSFRLLYITTTQYEADWISRLHSHYFAEIFYIKGGSGYMLIEREKIPLQAGSVVLIGAQVQHTEVSNTGDPLDYYVIGVEGVKLSTDRPVEYSVVTSSSNASMICQCFENILKEVRNEREGYAEICHHYLSILVLLICRKDSISYEFVDTQNSCRECYKAKQYIETHYFEKITLDGLSETCNLNKFYLCHKFSDIYGKSPMAYLTEVRIRVAKDLLKTTTYNMEEIAHAAGFSSNSYFSQVFLKDCEMTPQQYRKSHQEI